MKKFKNISVVLILTSLILIMFNVVVSAEVVLDNGMPYSVFEGSDCIKYMVSSDGEKVSVVIRDYNGQSVYETTEEVGEIIIPSLPYGWYHIEASDENSSTSDYFSVVPYQNDRRDSSDGPVAFAVMGAHGQSFTDYDDYLKTVSLAGIKHVREFFRADNIINEDGYSYPLRYDELMNAYKRNGMNVLLMFNDFPKSMCRDRNDTSSTREYVMPDDLLGVYRFTQNLCERYAGKIDTLEILNEPDLAGVAANTEKDGPELSAAVMKAAAIAAIDTDTDIKISNGGFSAWAGFMDVFRHRYLQSETGKFFNVYNNHFYYRYNDDILSPDRANDTTAAFFDDAKKYGMTDKPQWISEYAVRRNFTEGEDLTVEEQLIQAIDMPKTAIESIASGTDKIFWFLNGYRNENGVSYGTFGTEKKPYIVYSVISALTNALGNGVYAGTVEGLPEGVEGYCFEDGMERVICVWAESDSVLEFETASDVTVIDFMGNERKVVCTDGKITVNATDTVQYIRTTGEFINPRINRIRMTEKTDELIKLSDAERMVLLPQFDEKAIKNSRLEGYRLSTTSANTVRVKVYNFNKKEMSGTISALSTGGWRITEKEKNVIVAPMSCSEVQFEINYDSNVKFAEQTPLVFSGEFDGEKSTDSVCYIMTREIMEPDVAFEGQSNASQWSYGNIECDISWSENENAMGFSYNLAEATRNDGDIFFTLTTPLSTEDYDGIVFRYRADKSIGDCVVKMQLWENKWLFPSKYFATLSKDLDYYQNGTVNLGDEWRTAVFNWDSFVKTSGNGESFPKEIKKITIGFEYKGTENGVVPEIELPKEFTIYINNVGFYKDGSVIENCEINVDELSYDPESCILTTVVSGEIVSDNIKSVKHFINGKMYEAQLDEAVATLNITLPEGENTIYTTICDMANRPYSDERIIYVDRTRETILFDASCGEKTPDAIFAETGEKVVLPEMIPERQGYLFAGWRDSTGKYYLAGDEYTVLNSEVLYACWIKKADIRYTNTILFNEQETMAYVKGNASQYAGKRVTVIVYDCSSGGEITPDKVKLIDDLRIAADGNFVFGFQPKQDEKYRVVMNIDNNIFEADIESVEVSYGWMDSSIKVIKTENSIQVAVSTINYAQNDMACMAIIAYKGENGIFNSVDIKNIKVVSGNTTNTFSSRIPEDAKHAEVFWWSDNNAIQPLHIPTIINLK